MLLNFTVANFRSIKDSITLDLEAMGQVSEYKSNINKCDKYSGLKSVVLYGANGSGKSNIVEALRVMKLCILDSLRSEGEVLNRVESFALGMLSLEKEPCEFEAEFLIEGVKYRYGFAVTNKVVKSEWLFYTPKTSEKNLFYRSSADKEDIIEVSKDFIEGDQSLIEKTADNVLFLAVCRSFNGAIAAKVSAFFTKSLNVISGLRDRHLSLFSERMIQDDQAKLQILGMLNQADLGIEDIFLEKLTEDNLPTDLPERIKSRLLERNRLFSVRNRFDEQGNKMASIPLPFDKAESDGTQKYFHLAGPIYDTLKEGRCLVIDELDARLHPKLTTNIINLFHDEKINTKGAQLIFTTHDTNLLSSRLFRRDQIYFTEKNNVSATDLYSLAEFKCEDDKKVRKDASFEKDYLLGRYGAIPFVKSETFFQEHFSSVKGH